MPRPPRHGARRPGRWQAAQGDDTLRFDENPVIAAVRRLPTAQVLGDWLIGLFALARDAVTRAPTLIAALDTLIAAQRRRVPDRAAGAARPSAGSATRARRHRRTGRAPAWTRQRSGGSLADAARRCRGGARGRRCSSGWVRRSDAVLVRCDEARDA
jgi:hypothetical protein